MRLDAIGIACKDVEKTISFYGLLGVEFKKFGEGHFEGSCGGGLRLMLDTFDLLKKINPQWREPVEPGITLCFLQDSPRAVDQIYKRITDAGHLSEKEPWDAFWGQRYCSVRDPDGNQVDLFAPLSSP